MTTHVNVYCRANARRRMGILCPWIAGLPAVIALLCLQAAPSWAQWSPGGVMLCNYAASCQGRSPWIIADGHHGAYVAWSRVLGFSPEVDNIYLQHLTWAGTVNPGWPSAGLQITQVLTPEGTEGMAPDLEGGVYLLWADGRNGAGVGNGQAFLTRVTANGSIAAGWPAQGLNVAPDSTQGLGALAADGQGGVFVTLVDYRLGGFEGDIYVQHVLADGTIAPGWPALGKPVVRCPGQQAFFSEAPDGHGGLFAAWPTAAGTSANVQIQHMLADGSIAWDSCGRTIALGMTLGTLVPSRGGGIAVAAVLYPPSFADNDLYTVGFDSTGSIRPEWSGGPLPAVVAPSDQFNFDYASDGAGGLFVSWDDQRNYAIDATDRYVQHIMDNGAPAPGWAVNGVPAVASPIFDTQVGVGTTTPDGSGGVYVLPERTGNNDPSSGIYVGHVAAGGQVAPGWSPAGETLTLPPFGDGADGAMMCSDGAGGAIAVISALSILVQHISPDAPVPTEVSLSRVDARSDGVSLEWYAGGGGLAQAAVEREHGSDGWVELAQVTADGTGTLRYEDRAVVPGERYGYRLAYAANGTVAHTAETWVTVPLAARFALAGAVTNPSAVGALSLKFSLASWAPAELSLHDLTGRRVWRRAVGTLGAGEHTLAVGAETALAPGLYWARLQQGGQSATARMTLVE